MTQVNLADYKNVYLQTAREYVDSLLAACDKLAGDSQDKDAVNQIHISSHSLRSESQIMGFENMASLCAIIEKISNSALENKNKINSDLIAVLKESVKALSLCLFQIKKENKEGNLEKIVKKLEDAETSSA